MWYNKNTSYMAAASRPRLLHGKDQVIRLKTHSLTVQIPRQRMKERAADFIRTANSFKSSLIVSQGPNSVNAKSLLGFLSLDPGAGDEVTLTADGPDEAEALKVLSSLLEHSDT